MKTELLIVSKSQFSGSSPYSEDIFYICRPINDGDYYIIVRDCQVDSDRIYLAGDKLIIYGQGDDFTYAFAPDDTRMLDIIWESQVTDMGFILRVGSSSMNEIVSMLPIVCETGKSAASLIKSNLAGSEKMLEELFGQ